VQANGGSRVPFVFLLSAPSARAQAAARLQRPVVHRPASLGATDQSRTATLARKGFVMAKNIYVGNLVWDATQDDLYNLFQEHGKVTRAQVIMDRETGRSRGFGFVEMEIDSEADTAVNALNGADFRGRPLTVN
jgi:hypothetical protein